jgi:hypothetical protein
MRYAIVAAVAATLSSPVAAATVGLFDPGSLINPDFTAPLTQGGSQWNFGIPISGHQWESHYRAQYPGMNGGHSSVRLIGSDSCETVAAGSECLVGTIRYNNLVNVGAGPGTRDAAVGTFAGTIWNFLVSFTIEIDRTTNQQPGSGCVSNQFGCADQWWVNFTSPMEDFRIVGSGGFVHEEGSSDISIFWTRPATPPEVIPLPATAWLLGAGILGLGLARRRKRG